MKNYKIMVICALGYATSTMVKKNIVEFLEEKNITNWEVDSIGYNHAQGRKVDADLIVATLQLNPEEFGVPIIPGVALISGIGKDAVLQQILNNIQEIESKQE